MAGLTRKTSILFGNAGPTSAFGVFASKELGVTSTSQDPAVIQGLTSGWPQGWQNAIVVGSKAAFYQDMNGFCFVDSWQITYILQMGIPEWDSATLYFTGSVVQAAATGQWFKSLSGGVPGVGAGQSGNALPSSASNAFWLWINPPECLVGSSTLGTLQKVTSTAPSNGVPGSIALGDSLLSEAGGNVVLASGGIKFPDATIQTTAAASSNAVTVSSPPAAYRTVPIQPSGTSGSRALGVTYQNSSSKPLFVLITTDIGAGGSTVYYCDGTTSPVTVVATALAGGGVSAWWPVMLIVLPGYWYKATGGTLESWTEWS